MSARTIINMGSDVLRSTHEKIMDASSFHPVCFQSIPLVTWLTGIQEKVNKTYWIPCAANDSHARCCTYTSFEKSQVHPPIFTMADMNAAVLVSKESLDGPTLIIEGHEEFARYRGKGTGKILYSFTTVLLLKLPLSVLVHGSLAYGSCF